MLNASAGAVVSATEVARFDALADGLVGPASPMRPLHAMNPARRRLVDARLPAPPACSMSAAAPACSPRRSAREGHQVTGLDAAGAAIAAARAPCRELGLAIDLPRRPRRGPAPAEGARFDAVTALEVVEHVPNPARFIATLAGLLLPGGRLFLSTLNRTARSFLVAKLGAEYVMRLLPIGTHDWQAFLKPSRARPPRPRRRPLGGRHGPARPRPRRKMAHHHRTAVNYLMTATAPSA
jgi:2-polyprenyl-6-hydroxyphenyl methylase/3-demethylubiquinone-9 3-methyltransferase